ncbi:MAG: NUDIX hydrolase [Woeseiaceae bacterium]|nr:NUDIX hydrolase [Woeseiaceae bacterium]
MSWKKLSSRRVFDNPWLTVFEDHVVNPGGGENQYGWVHFKNHAVAVVPIDDDDHTWLVGQDRYTLGEYSWEVPMGGSPVGEDLEASARRELQEETGLSAGRLRQIMKVHTSNSITDESGFVFVATELRQGEASPEETEDLRVRRLPLADALAMVLDGEITDAISCVALLRIAALDRSHSERLAVTT